jgi:uncharacterized repeat protein (TIGR01451 family)
MMNRKLSLFSILACLLVISLNFYSWLKKSAHIIRLLLLAGLSLQTSAVHAFGATQCAADRIFDAKGNTSIECTAGDVSITRIAIFPGTGTNLTDPTTGTVPSANACVSGTFPHYDFDLTVQFATPNRWDIGIFLVNDGKDPHYLKTSGGPQTCSVDVLTSPGHETAANPVSHFLDLDGAVIGYPTDWCGDGNGAMNGTGAGQHRMNDVSVYCKANPLSKGKLAVPFVVSWDNQSTPSGAICSSNLDPVPNTVAKCNSPNQALQEDVDKETLEIVVVPPITKTDNKTTTSIGETNVYEIKIDNVTGITLANTKFSDPAVTGLTVTSVTCTALPVGTSLASTVTPTSTNAGVCPAVGLVTVANLQGGGIPLPDQLDASAIKFTVTAKVTSAASGSLTNKARVTVTAPSIINPGTTVTGYSEASDTDTLGASPTLTLVKRVINNDGGTKLPTGFTLSATGSDAVASGTPTTYSAVNATTNEGTAASSVSLPSGSYVLTETLASGAAVTGYAASWTCTGAASVSGTTVTINAGQNATCTAINDDDAAKLTIRKITKGATAALGAGGPFVFNGSGANANGIPADNSLTATTVTPGTAVATTQVSLGSSNVNTIFTETLPDNTWVITSASCVDQNGAVTGNGTGAFTIPFNQTGSSATVSGISIPANGIAIPAARVKGGAILVCDVTNSRSTLKLTKKTFPTGSTNTFTLSIDGTVRTSPTVVDGGSTLDIPLSATATHTVGEDAIVPDNFFTGGNKYQLVLTCNDTYGNTTVSPVTFDVGGLGNAGYTSGSLNVFPSLSATTPVDDKNLQVQCLFQNSSGASLIIKKVAIPNSASTSFPFTLKQGATTVASPSLSGSNDNTSNIATVSITKNKTYVLTEDLTALTDWTFVSSSCIINGTSDLASDLTIPNVNDVAAECIFTNKRKTAITVKKVVAGNTTDTFDLKVNGSSVAVTSPAAKAAGNFVNGDSGRVVLGSGAFTPTVAETVNANYNTTLTCIDDTTGQIVSSISDLTYTGGNQSLSLADTQQVTCTFTNTRKINLTVAKTVVSRALLADEFTVSINKGGSSATTSGGNVTSIAFEASKDVQYTFQEFPGNTGTVLNNYTTTYACTNTKAGSTTVLPSGTGTSFTLTPLEAGDNITCTFTNTKKPTTVKFTKTTSAGFGGAFGFTLTNTTLNNPNTVTTVAADTPVQVDGDNGTAGAQNFTVSNLSQIIDIEETSTPTGWTLTNIGCSGLKDADTITVTGNKATIPASSVIGGATIECNFTNTKNATVTVVKSIPAGSDDGTKFNLFVKQGATTLGSATAVGNAGTTGAISVPAGSAVSVSEDVNTGSGTGTPLSKYTATVNCPGTDVNNVAFDPDNPPSFIPTAGQTVTCTFTNSLQPKLKLVKKIVGYTEPTDKFVVSVTPSGPSATVEAAGLDGETTVYVADPATTYTFTETAGASTPATNLANYTTTYSCTNATAGSATALPSGTGLSFSVTPTYKDDITCTFTNTSSTGKIRLLKALSVNRSANTDQFTIQIKDSSGTVMNSTANSTTTGAGSTVTAGTGTTGSTTLTPGTYTLTEAAAGTTSLANYGANLKCYNHSVLMASPLDGTAIFNPSTTTKTVALVAGDDIVCTLTNGAPASTGAPLTIEKTTVDGTGSFSYTIVNGATTLPVVSLDTGTNNPKTSAVQTLPNTGSSATITETPAVGWAVTAASCTDGTTTWKAASTTVTIPSVNSAKTYSCKFTNQKIGPSITGIVFSDTGTGAGIANNGIKDGTETGIPKVTVKLTNCAGTVYHTTTTDGNGNYSLPTTGVPAAPVCIEESNAASYLSTGASISNTTLPSGTPTTVTGTSYEYNRTTDKISFTLAADTSYSGLNFADVPDNRFLTDGSKTGRPGTTVSYPHIFVAGTGGKVTFSFPGATAVPSLPGWHESLYRDANCDGILNTNAPSTDSLAPTTAITVTAGEKICLIMQEFIPSGIPLAASNLVPIKADFEYTNSLPAPAITASYTRQDLTRVTDQALDLMKMVCTVNSDDTTGACSITNNAKSGQKLEYQITYTNNGISAIDNLVVNDATPAYTSFISASAGAFPANLTACQKNTPTSAVAIPCANADTVGGTGGIKWQFTGKLQPGASGKVIFRVTVD